MHSQSLPCTTAFKWSILILYQLNFRGKIDRFLNSMSLHLCITLLLLHSYEKHWLPFLPALVAMSLASMVIVVSLSTKYKLFFQVSVFLTSFIASITYLYTKTKKLQPLLKAFNLLGDDVKFTLSIVVICVTYFVGGMYFDVDNDVEVLNVSPAAADSSVTFTVPAKLPADDKELFLETFDKLCAEIIADLKPIYEMPDEAIQYVEKMLVYTVAGEYIGICIHAQIN